ncbi:MAG: sigma-70 family RNA polymerase sigma factor [Bryobacteraceae bacterium]
MQLVAQNIEPADIVSRIRNGDAAGMEDLYSALWSAAKPKLSRTVDSQLVEDKFHDVVVTVLEAIRSGTLRDPSRLMGFVQTITRRRVAAHIRGKISRRKRLVSMGPSEFPGPAAEIPGWVSLETERLKVLRVAIRCLCSRDKEILVRFYLKEEKPQQICSEMGLTPTQFRLYKSRALSRCADSVRQAPVGAN